MDSGELVRRLRDSGSSDPLWAEFVRRCRITIRLTLRRRAKIPGLIEDRADLEQEVLKRLISGNRMRLRQFDGRRTVSLEGYVRRVTDTVVMDWQRRRQRREAEISAAFSREDTERLERRVHRVFANPATLHPEHDLRIREVEEIVQAYLEATLADPMDRAVSRRIFRLHFREGYSIQQIARLKAVPLSASAISRRANTLRRYLQTVLESTSDL